MDVEYAHAMAPSARILLVETPVSETIGKTAFPQMVRAENYVINHHLAGVISQSFGTAEETFPNTRALRHLRSAYVNGKKHRVTVLAETGDSGATQEKDLKGDFFQRRVTAWPASDPLVTAVGGTQVHLRDNGARRRRDTAWNDSRRCSCPSAGGGGISSVFVRPRYQKSVKAVVKHHRGIPDVSLSASHQGGALVYESYSPRDPQASPAGYQIVGGTSLATPLFAGIVAVADQAAGRRLGLLNRALYKLGSGSPALPDITKGNTRVTFTQGESGKRVTVKGYHATKGYDLATGLGSVDGTRLVEALSGRRLSL